MPAVAFDEAAQEWAERLERGEAARTGALIKDARLRVAARTGVQPGTLENLRRGRIKGVRGWVYERLRAAVIAELQREIAALSHELEMLRSGGAHPGSDEIAEVVAGISTLRRALSGGPA